MISGGFLIFVFDCNTKEYLHDGIISLPRILALTSFSDYHELVTGIDANGHIFRGVRDGENHLLIPSLGRLTPSQRGNTGLGSYEKRIFNQFKQTAVAYLTSVPSTDLDWLALAQHHGLPTRLLDWSYNPLVALFFAVEGQDFTDSAVYMYKVRKKTLHSRDDLDPFTISSVGKFSPDHSSDRIKAQKGLFTLHPNPREELNDDERMTKIHIPMELRQELKYALRRYDVNPVTIFPGLDGLTAYILER